MDADTCTHQRGTCNPLTVSTTYDACLSGQVAFPTFPFSTFDNNSQLFFLSYSLIILKFAVNVTHMTRIQSRTVQIFNFSLGPYRDEEMVFNYRDQTVLHYLAPTFIKVSPYSSPTVLSGIWMRKSAIPVPT